MSNDSAKIRLKIGQLEVEYEGSSSFLEEGLFNLLEKTMSFYSEHRASIPSDPLGAMNAGAASAAGQSGNLSLTTGTIAARLSASTGPELAIAAAAKLAMVDGKAKFSRQGILDEMKNATDFYKANMSGNLSSSMSSLVKGKRLNEVSKGIYALSSTEKQSLGVKLAE